MPLFYGSPAEGVTYPESAEADAWYLKAVYAAAGGVVKAEAGDEDDGTT